MMMKKDDKISFRFNFDSFPLDDPIREVALKLNRDKYLFRYEAFFFGRQDLKIYPLSKTLQGQDVIIPYPGLDREVKQLLPADDPKKISLSINSEQFEKMSFIEADLP